MLFVIVCGIIAFYLWRRKKILSRNTEPKLPLGAEISQNNQQNSPTTLYPTLPPYETPPMNRRQLPTVYQPTATHVENLYVDVSKCR